jgi:hypothetical protein
MKSLKNMLVVAALILGAAFALKYALSETPEVTPMAPVAASHAPSAQAPSKSDTASNPSPSQPAIPPLLSRPELVQLPEDDGEHGEFTTSTDILKQKLFKREPRLAQFDFFREHVLLDSVSRKSYRKLLADKAMIDQTRDELLHPRELEDTMEVNVKRLMQIDYLRESLSWEENPERSYLLRAVESVLLEDSFTEEMPSDVKRSLAATKMELYEILSDQEPAFALALVDKARGTRLEKMFQYFAEHNQRRVAKERELSLQAQKSTDKP